MAKKAAACLNPSWPYQERLTTQDRYSADLEAICLQVNIYRRQHRSRIIQTEESGNKRRGARMFRESESYVMLVMVLDLVGIT